MRCLNDPLCLPIDESGTKTRRSKPKEAIMKSRTASGKLSEGYKKYQMLPVISLKNIRVDERMYVNYGMMYQFEKSNIKILYNQKKRDTEESDCAGSLSNPEKRYGLLAKTGNSRKSGAKLSS